jgi:hypothetical protein
LPDGYCQETNTIYEFYGDYWHEIQNFIHRKINKTTFGEFIPKTLDKERKIMDLGYNLITIWENDWNILNRGVKILQRKFRSFNRR